MKKFALHAISIVCLSSLSFAYVTEIGDPHWNESKVFYSFRKKIPNNWKASINNAASIWNSAGANFEFIQVVNSSNFIDRMDLGYDDDGKLIVGIGASEYSTSDYIIYQSYTWLTNNKKVRWSTRGAANKVDVTTVALHEFGHWLFLDDNPSVPQSIMAGEYYRVQRYLDNDDIAGIKYLYPGTDTVKITDAIPQRETSYSGEIFYTTNFDYNYHGGTVILSQYQDGTGSTCVDDSITIKVTHPDGSDSYWGHIYSPGYTFPQPLPPVDVSSIFVSGVNSVYVELKDRWGSLISSTSLWLVGGAVPGKAISGEKYENQFIADVDSGGRIKKSENYQFELFPNYPNPTKEIANIQFSIPKAGKVELKIYNLAGQLVKVLVNENMPAGKHQCSWVGRDESNHKVGQGVYIYRMTAGAFSATKKLIWVK